MLDVRLEIRDGKDHALGDEGLSPYWEDKSE